MKHVLALNTFNGTQQVFSVNPDGGHVKMDFYFPGNIEVHQSCSVVFKNKMFIFGGKKEQRQISEVSSNCGIDRIGDLSFDFVRGACTVINEDEIMLCFDLKQPDQGRVCRIDKNPTGSLDKISQESNHYHYRSKIAANKGKQLNPYDDVNLVLKNLYLIKLIRIICIIFHFSSSNDCWKCQKDQRKR